MANKLLQVQLENMWRPLINIINNKYLDTPECRRFAFARETYWQHPRRFFKGIWGRPIKYHWNVKWTNRKA